MEIIIEKDKDNFIVNITIKSDSTIKEYTLKVDEKYILLIPGHSETHFIELFRILGLSTREYREYMCDWIEESGLQLNGTYYGRTSPEYKYAEDSEREKLMNVIYDHLNLVINPNFSPKQEIAIEEDLLL